uniref:G-protein coupled receptors family 1 profile domain-containing protein n=1 Tax=Romanomermis culicivorax TaxID=13658 RepID=A0A915LAM5_ROMCU
MNNCTNFTLSIADQCSREQIRSHLYSTIEWIAVCSVNIMASCFTLVTISCWKNLHTQTMALICALMITEMCDSSVHVSLHCFHLYNYLSEGSEFMTTQKCVYISFVQMIPTFASAILSFLISLDRLQALIFPIYHSVRSKLYVIISISGSIITGVVFYLTSFFLPKKNSYVTMCSYRTVDFDFNTFILYFLTFVCLSTTLIYSFMLIYTRFSVVNANTTLANRILADKRLTVALAWAALAYLFSSEFQWLSSVVLRALSFDQYYDIGIYFGPVACVEGLLTAIFLYANVQEFRNGAESLLFRLKMC